MQVHIADPEGFARKIEAIKTAGAKNLHFVADFDQTLTKAFDNGKPLPSTPGLMRANGYLSPEYVQASYALHDKYIPYEYDDSLSHEDRCAKMHEWWSEHLNLLIRSGMHRDIITDIVTKHKLHLREGFNDLVVLTAHKNVPFLIFSAGFGDIVEGYLDETRRQHSNVHVISNFFTFDSHGAVTGYASDIIHVFNKGETAIHGTPYAKEIAARRNVILLGDSLGDITMAAGMEHDAVLRIGFLNGRTERLEKYAEAFDVVLLEDGSLEYIIELLKEIE